VRGLGLGEEDNRPASVASVGKRDLEQEQEQVKRAEQSDR
jgi:hypothetical protein